MSDTQIDDNPQLETARRYVERTGVSLFLTGKAGTGKTTFLHEIDRTTSKRHVVLAPTGVAAINAGGVTIHSFFQLPFDPYLPDVKELVTEYQMPDRYKSLSKNKIHIIRTLELLIIDEISMVRADLLDAIDMTLRRYRRSSRPFGGVQLLMIGDVHQLSPVVTENERPYMQRVYPTPYFFASKALQQMNYVTIELTTVYRQQDAAFVDLLNHVRDNNIDADTLSKLNARVQPTQAITQSRNQAITLTTHNRQADAINRRHLDALTGERRVFEAILKGDFPEKNLPCDSSLEVKVGERVMFVKNDSSSARRYYNGKLGTVTGFTDKAIEVIDDEGDIIEVEREVWESMKYTLNAKTNEIEQKVEGTFSQYPLQAAWAVTIHKAQGLTFDRVAIDAADAFAFGQVYVALSRCRTLEGLTLTTPLTAGVAFSDTAVNNFVNTQPSFEETVLASVKYESEYRLEKLMELFSVDDLLHNSEQLHERYSKLKSLYPTQLALLSAHISLLQDLQGVSERFKNQLLHLDEAAQNLRAQQGAEYYLSQLTTFRPLLSTLLEVDIDNKETAKGVSEAGKQLSETLEAKLACLEAVKEHGYSLQTIQDVRNNEGEKRKAKKGERKKKDEEKRDKQKTGPDETSTQMPDLITLIKQWRTDKSKELNLPPYMVLQQKALLAIVDEKPLSLNELEQLPGIGPATVKRYGAELVGLVAESVGKIEQ